jgi:hypothetical protein
MKLLITVRKAIVIVIVITLITIITTVYDNMLIS